MTSPIHRPAADRGFTLIEVLVAMMVFGVVSVLVAYALTLSMTLTRSNRANEVAANLASQQIDVARSAGDVFSVTSGTLVQTVNGTTYTIAKTAGWVTSTGAAADCGGASGLLQNKTLNVSVSWSGMRPGTAPVQASTLLAPAGPINDPASGTIIVHVTGATGAAMSGVAIAVKPDAAISPNTATPISPAPAATDADGCSFILKAVPGSYTVTVGKAGDGMVSSKQANAPSFSAPVTAGQSSVVNVQYDTAATPKLTLSPGAPAGTLFPTTAADPSQTSRPLPVSFVSQTDPFTAAVSPSTSGGATTATVSVFPYASGYQAFAGTYANASGQPICLSLDPGAWVNPNGSGHVGQRQPAIPVGAGATGAVPMPVLTVTVSGKWIVAVNSAAASSVGDPGCATGQTLRFPVSSGNSAKIALPYGTWKLYALSGKGDSLAAGALVDKSKIALPAGSTVFSDANTFTIDPRAL